MTAEVLNYTEDAYQQGYTDAIEDMRKRHERRIKRQQERKARRWYFFKQKAAGLMMLVLTVVAVRALDGDATVALITVPLGLYLVFTKEMAITNSYYFEVMNEREELWKRKHYSE